jgi:hypothetical protein
MGVPIPPLNVGIGDYVRTLIVEPIEATTPDHGPAGAAR